MRLNVERTNDGINSVGRNPFWIEETEITDEGKILGLGRLRGGWFTLPRAWRLSADKPKTSDPTNLQTCINEMKEPTLPIPLPLSLSLCSRVHSLPLPPKLEISVDLCLDRARIKRNSRVSRTRCFHLVLRRIAIKQNGGLNGRALLLYVHLCVRYVSILP